MDFEDIKQVRLTEVCGRYGIKLRFKGEWASAPCPLPTHKQGDKKQDFSVNVQGNFWKCWSRSCNRNNGGKQGGDVINFVALMENCREYEAAQKLAGWYNLNGNKTAPQIEARAQPNSSPDHNLPRDSVKMRYMQETDQWFDALVARREGEMDEEYWKRVRNGVKARLLESYKNGKKVAASN